MFAALRHDAHVDGTEDSRTEAAQQDAELRGILTVAHVERKASHEQSHRKADTGQHTATPQNLPGVAGLDRYAHLHGEQAEQEDADGLAEHKRQRDRQASAPAAPPKAAEMPKDDDWDLPEGLDGNAFVPIEAE